MIHIRTLFTGARLLQKQTGASVSEMAHFNALASSWWDVNGPQRILHKMNLLRMDFIAETIRNNLQLNDGTTPPEEEIYVPPYNLDLLPKPIRATIVKDQELKRMELLSQTSLKALDVGCGGGILSESLARLNYISSVKGIDLSNEVVEAAKQHQKSDPSLTKLNYELTAIEDLPPNETFDLITAFEMLEHVNYPSEVLSEILLRLNVGGHLFISTINRDFVSWFTTIFMGEHILRIVPVGTHTLDKYIDRKEIQAWMNDKENFKVTDVRGCLYVPAKGWEFTSCPDIGNYFMAIRRVK